MAGAGTTVTTFDVTQPVGSVYDIVVVPTARPVITPVPEMIDAFEGVTLSHVPPGVELSAVVVPTQIVVFPVIDAGNGFTLTVTLFVVVQPAKLVAVTL